MADLSKVRIGSSDYNLKDAAAREAIGDETKGLIKSLADEAAARAAADTTLQTNITAEADRAKGVEGGLDERITNLEARGRFLSNWNAATGKPETDPAALPYLLKSGDYYIVGTVSSADPKVNYQPEAKTVEGKEGLYYTGVASTTAETRELGIGDYYTFDGTKWILVSNSQKTVSFANIAGKAKDNADLKSELESLVPQTTKVAGLALSGDIAKADLQSALDLKALAYKDSATGTVAGQTITGIKASYTPTGSITLDALNQTSTAASLTKAAYTPAGSVTGDAIKDGTIAVTVKDAASATAVTDLTYDNYTPAGTVAAKATGGTSAVLASAKFEADANGTAVSGTVSKPNVTVTAGTEKTFATGLTGGSKASFTEGAFTPAAIQSGFYTAGSDASLSAGAQASLTAQTTNKFAKKAYSFAAGTGADAETLIISEVATTDTSYYADAVTDRGTFTANTLQTLTGGKATVIDTTKFSGGEKAADTFVANELQSVETGTVHDTPTAALAEAPTFTGDKFRVATTTDTVLKDVEFTGTAAAVKLTGAKYLKQEIDTATFTGTAATLGFAGTEVKDFQVTGVNYDKATINADGATFAGEAGQADVGTITVEAKSVTVS